MPGCAILGLPGCQLLKPPWLLGVIGKRETALCKPWPDALPGCAPGSLAAGSLVLHRMWGEVPVVTVWGREWQCSPMSGLGQASDAPGLRAVPLLSSSQLRATVWREHLRSLSPGWVLPWHLGGGLWHGRGGRSRRGL